MILALTGSMGSGKSTVADMIRDMSNAVIIDADAIVRSLQEPGQPVFREMVKEFGREIVGPDGKLDRKRVAELAFADESGRERLNAIVHPAVLEEQKRLLDRHREAPLVVLSVPLLFETGMEALADRVLVVTTGESERLERLAVRSAMTAGQVRARLAAQIPQEEKIRRADYIIDNSGPFEATRQQVAKLLRQLGAAS